MIQRIGIVCFNTQPHEGGCLPPTGGSGRTGLFQHTAARRRLPAHQKTTLQAMPGFNTQPRGGGCKTFSPGRYPPFLFQHTAARRRLPCVNRYFKGDKLFQHTAARRRLPVAGRGCFTLTNSFNTQPHEGGCNGATSE